MVDARTLVTFETDGEIWEDIIPLQSTAMMKGGVQTHIQVRVLNNNHHDAQSCNPRVTSSDSVNFTY